MSEILERLGENSKMASTLSLRLKTLSDGFFITGNQKMGAQLENISSILEKMAEDIHDIGGQYCDETLKASEQSSANTLNACLAMAQIAGEKEQ